MPDYLPKHSPGQQVTYTASAAIVGGQLVTITGDLLVGPTAGAGVVEGVATRDAAVGQAVNVRDGGIQLLVASAAIAAGQRVQSAANGQVAPFAPAAAGLVSADVNVIGHATQPIAAGAAGRVRLY